MCLAKVGTAVLEKIILHSSDSEGGCIFIYVCVCVCVIVYGLEQMLMNGWINLLKSSLAKINSRVSRRGDEVEAAVHSGVRDALLSGDVDFFFQELLVLLVDVL